VSKNLVLVPVYNEEETIAAVLSELRKHYDGDILIIDDGSRDASAGIVKGLALPGLSMLSHADNRGYGAALIDGFKHAAENGYDVVVTMDCDWQHEPCQVPEFLEGIADCDVLSGSRYFGDCPSRDPAPPDRQRINAAVTGRLNQLLGLAITDAFCGFKAYRVSALRRLSLDERGYAFPLQFWVQCRVFNLRLREICVERIYLHANRSFGAELDDPERRLRYYESVIEKEKRRWGLT